MVVRFHIDALLEYEDAVQYYEGIQEGLGERLASEVEEILAVTLELPAMGGLVRTRRLSSVSDDVFSVDSASRSTTWSLEQS